MDQYANLDHNSHTYHRLAHALPEHLYRTTRRCFIGPIPEGWLKSHRKSWRKRHLHINYSSRAATFSADENVSHQRRVTGLEAARGDHSFPQPHMLEEDAAHNISPIPEGSESSTRISEGADASTSSLIRRNAKSQGEVMRQESPVQQHIQTVSPNVSDNDETDNMDKTVTNSTSTHRRTSRIHFDLPEDSTRAALLSKARMTQLQLSRPLSKVLKRRSTLDGQIIKMEKMLVRVDTTLEHKLPDDYDENSSQSVISTTLEKWREFMVVCRKTTADADSDFVLQIYKTRVIPAIETSKSTKRATREIPLSKSQAGVNLYSSLDKTVVVWVPDSKGTKIILLRPRTSADGVEWYTFLRNILGWKRASELQVNVPDLDVNLHIEDPFQEFEKSSSEEAYDEESTVRRTMEKEQVVAQEIINRCVGIIKELPDWSEMIDNWTREKRMGLAWKRYDRLEWLHGEQERKMFGTMAISRSHDLELRPKEHYPTVAQTKKGKQIEEPVPVEGFLIRLTSQKGIHQRMGKLFFKRLYFHTHDRYLFFSRPARADPPPPPKNIGFAENDVPSAHELAEKIPIIYAITPYPVQDGQITWLESGTTTSFRQHDDAASDELHRKFNNITDSDGFIDLCNVVKVRNVHRGATPADDVIDEGSDVDFDMEVSDDNLTDDGATNEIDDARTFELVLRNRLVIRLQAYDKQTKKEWKLRLRALVKYWNHRHRGDIELLKSVRQQNLSELQIDEETEAIVGQFAKKWEVTKSYASAELYNICGISCCRTITMSGPLYRKPRLHSLFTALHCVLVPGKLLLFSTTLRSRTGESIPHIHHEKLDAIDLSECYLYSGLLTENDLLYQNQTFDSNYPGHNALPKMWLEDQWTSRDEDVMTSFVLWRPLNRGWFRSPGEREGEKEKKERTDVEAKSMRARLKRVSQLGATGRSIVFKARSRAERDHWVLALGTEIERLAGGEDVRITKDE